MKILVTFYIGMFDKDTHRQELNFDDFKQTLNDTFDCYTLTQCESCFKHNNGIFVNEPTLKIEYIDYNLTLNIKKICNKLKTKLNQECIMVTTQVLNVEFI